jgi:AraC-like DNA-binding protein
MQDIVEQAVERVVRSMYESFGEQLTIDDMARTALFSKFHFSRVFRQVTGISPGRFLSAVRLHMAKRLLISTSLTVAEISNRVGYTSVGTFSSRFKSSVGVAPTLYRQSREYWALIPLNRHRNTWATRYADVWGEILAPHTGGIGPMFVGLFSEAILQGSPVQCVMLERPGPYTLEHVPQGTWYVLAHSIAPGDREDAIVPDPSASSPRPWVGSQGPVTIAPGVADKPVDVLLRPMQVIDPPALLALADTRLDVLDASGS